MSENLLVENILLIIEDALTNLFELNHHGSKANFNLRYQLNHEHAKILDLTNKHVAK